MWGFEGWNGDSHEGMGSLTMVWSLLQWEGVYVDVLENCRKDPWSREALQLNEEVATSNKPGRREGRRGNLPQDLRV